MARIFFPVFAGFAYAVFFATFLYLIAFTGNLPVTSTVDGGATIGGWVAVAVDIALIASFGLQHSIMARQSFKRGWTRIVPPPLERSAYVLIASAMLLLLFHFWQPIPGIVWRVEGALAVLLWALFALGWLLVLISTFLINHFELFGLHQVWRHVRGQEAGAPQFRTPLLYRLVRHPLYSGFFLAFWATPVMSIGHLLLAAGMSAYMLIAIAYEERDLVALFGKNYEDYRRKVGMLLPGVGRRG